MLLQAGSSLMRNPKELDGLLDEQASHHLQQMWNMSKSECVCQTDTCPNRSASLAFAQSTGTCSEAGGQDGCEPCLFVNSTRSACPRSAHDIKYSCTMAFRQRVLLAGPVSRLTQFLTRSLGNGSKPLLEFKKCAGKLLGCQERLLSSIRSLGALQRTCPKLTEICLASGFSAFWDMAELFERAVERNVGLEMRAHALARIKLRLAKRAALEASGVQRLEEWLVFLQADGDQERRLLEDVFGCADIWEAASKVYGTGEPPPLILTN